MARRHILAALAATSIFGAAPATAEVLQYHPNSPAYIGGNFDPSYPGRAYPACLVRTFVRGASLLPGQKPGTATATQFLLKKVTSRRELYRLLNVSLSVSGSYGLFSADFSGSLEQENTFSEESFTWIIQGYTNFGKFILDKTDLDPEAKALRNNPVAFRNRCGTDFVGQEVRAAQATAVFTIKNLSQTERKVLEAKFSGSYGAGPLDISGSASYRDFVKTAAAYGQIEVRVYALGGPGALALAPIITNVDKPDVVLDTIKKYFDNLTLDQSAPVAYNTGSIQSLIGNPDIETDIYNKYIADVFAAWEDLGAQQIRLRKAVASPDDWGLTSESTDRVKTEIDALQALRNNALKSALACKQAFTTTGTSLATRRAACVSGSQPFLNYAPKFVGLLPKPYYLRYFVTNELIPGEEVLNFTVRASTLKNVTVVKKLSTDNASFEAINSTEVRTAADGSREAGTSVIMKDIQDVELPLGLKIELDSGNIYFERLAFTRAPLAAAPALDAAITLPASAQPPALLTATTAPAALAIDKKAFDQALKVGSSLPSQWVEQGNKK